ncbi:hypothetical protein KPL74_20680 [Bacillus sp. NP157]|nr:hypothetical protein KPL74_20680 [Bacillus sp. NP157]
MPSIDSITRSFSIVDHTLRQMFSDSYWKRCMYAALGMRELLRVQGVSAEMVFGDMACFTVSPDWHTTSWQGFRNTESANAAHFWLETSSYLLDLGPHYLPAESSHPIAPIPPVRLPFHEGEPRYLRYRARGRGEVDLDGDPGLAGRATAFIAQCLTTHRSVAARDLPAFTWQLSGTSSLLTAARKGDTWARGATQIVNGHVPPPAPI